MNPRQIFCSLLLLRKLERRTRGVGWLHRLANADAEILSLLPTSHAKNFALMGMSMVFCMVLIFLATLHVNLTFAPTGIPALDWVIALMLAGLLSSGYLAIVRILILLPRVGNHWWRRATIAGAMLLSLAFATIGSVSLREVVFAGAIEYEIYAIQLQGGSSDGTDLAVSRASPARSQASDGELRKVAWKRLRQEMDFELAAVTTAGAGLYLLIAWAPLLVMQAIRNTEYGCLHVTLEQWLRVLKHQGIPLNQNTGSLVGILPKPAKDHLLNTGGKNHVET